MEGPTELAQLRMLIEKSAGNRDRLKVIFEEIANHPAPEVRRHRIRVAELMRNAGQEGSVNSAQEPGSPPAPPGLWKRILRSNHLDFPDERPLHAYELTSELEAEIQKELRHHLNRHNLEVTPESASYFCLWAARWFGRTYRGGTRRWQDLFSAIAGRELDGNIGRTMARDGLVVWRRPVALGSATCQWLMTLAIEGGFPVGVLEEAGGWAASYIEALVSRLSSLDDPTAGDAREIAARCSDIAPTAYRQETFHAVAAELALVVARLRKTCSTENIEGIPHSVWLDAHHPQWRNELPVSLNTAMSRRLIEGLVDMPTEKGLFAGRVGVSRLLRRNGEKWSFGLRFLADGVLRNGFLDGGATQLERLRVHPSGEFARFSDGELAVLDPPIEDSTGWRVYPARNRTTDGDVPLNIPAKIELRSGGRAIRQLLWPGGEAVTGDFLVFSDLSESGTGGQEAEYLGRSSGKFVPEKVLLITPLDWSTTASSEGSKAECIASNVLNGHSIIRIEGSAIIKSPTGDRFYVASNQSMGARDQISLSGGTPSGFEPLDGDIELYCGAPTITLHEGDRERVPRPNEVKWRPSGRRQWENTSISKATGRIDVGWIELDSGYLRDRRKICILPPDTGLVPRRSKGCVDYRVTGRPPTDFVTDQPLLRLAYDQSGFQATFEQAPSRRAKLRVKLNESDWLPIIANYPIGSGLARWDGRPVAGSGSRGTAPTVTLRDLRELVAHADGRDRILVEIRKRDGGAGEGRVDWTFEDECPLRTLADQIEWLFDQNDDIDAHAIITLQGPGLNWRVERFALQPKFDKQRRLTGFHGIDPEMDLEIVGRSVLHPEIEVSFAKAHSTDLLEHGVPDLEVGRGGVWIIYLRSDRTIVGRPSIVRFQGEAAEPARTGIGVAAGISDEDRRSDALRKRLQAIAGGRAETREEIRQLVGICTGLNGLPAAGFDILRHLVATPVAFARVALAAGDDASQVLRLDEQMPFLSCGIPWSAWEEARRIEEEYVGNLLASALGPSFDRNLVERTSAATAARLISIDPLLAGPLWAATYPGVSIPSARDLHESAQDFIRRHGDETREAAPTPLIHRSDPSRPMPQVFSRFDESHLDALDAPCAAAAAAAGRASLSREELRSIKATRRLDPIYFEEAFTRRFVELSRRPKPI